jgi:heptosyltransferase-2/heptosyltransferase-3
LRYGQRATAAPVRRVLLVRPDHLGDLLFLTPGLRTLRQALPDAHLTLLVGPWNTDVVRDNPDLDAVITCAFPGFERRPKESLAAPYRLLTETARRLRRETFDTAVVLRFDHWWGAWLTAEAGIPRRIGYDLPETRPFLTDVVPYAPDRHEVLQNVQLLDRLAPSRGAMPGLSRFVVATEDAAWAESWLSAQALSRTRPLVAIHSGAGAAVKQWPAERWAAIARRLIEHCDAQIVVTGSAGERPLADALVAHAGCPVLNAAGQTTLGQLAALLARCALVLGADCGPLHLAVAVGTPTVHLHGPVDAARFGPWGPETRHRVVRSGWPCVPCNRLDWPQEILAAHACMAAIDEEPVWQAARELLSEGQGSTD